MSRCDISENTNTPVMKPKRAGDYEEGRSNRVLGEINLNALYTAYKEKDYLEDILGQPLTEKDNTLPPGAKEMDGSKLTNTEYPEVLLPSAPDTVGDFENKDDGTTDTTEYWKKHVHTESVEVMNTGASPEIDAIWDKELNERKEESDMYNPSKVKVTWGVDNLVYGAVEDHPITIESPFGKNIKINKEETQMTNKTRNIVKVTLIDEDAGLPVENSLVFSWEGITEDSVDVTIQELLMNEDVKEALHRHNEKRVEIVDKEILKRTGNRVNLDTVKLKDLSWKVKA